MRYGPKLSLYIMMDSKICRKWSSVAEAPAARAVDFQGRWCRQRPSLSKQRGESPHILKDL